MAYIFYFRIRVEYRIVIALLGNPFIIIINFTLCLHYHTPHPKKIISQRADPPHGIYQRADPPLGWWEDGALVYCTSKVHPPPSRMSPYIH